jgi:hypothetical protein
MRNFRCSEFRRVDVVSDEREKRRGMCRDRRRREEGRKKEE